MKTTIEAVRVVWKYLSESALKNVIHGGIYKKRPLNSKAEDIVINCLPIDGRQLQETVLNVNIHVPNLTINTGNNQDSTQPDMDRLEELASLATNLLPDVWLEDMNFSIESQTLIEVNEPDINEHFINIRLRAYAVNI